MLQFQNTFANLPEQFFQRIRPESDFQAELKLFNQYLWSELSDDQATDQQKLAEVLSGARILPGSDPIAMAYAGHQFGHFVPQLGDGRAHLLGEVLTKKGIRYDIQLKGSGQTAFSRGGDGLCPLGPAVREFLIAHYLYSIGIDCTQVLSVVQTDRKLWRENLLPAAVVCRVARGHIRIGSFEYFASRQDFESVRLLADYCIERFQISVPEGECPYHHFFLNRSKLLIRLVAQWMSYGFVHGVMNTDNMNLSGEAIDFGPCAFLDEYKNEKLFSSIDRNGRYAYGQQGKIAVWNLSNLGYCLLPLMAGDSLEQKQTRLQKDCEQLLAEFEREYMIQMGEKLGLSADQSVANESVIANFLRFLEMNELDFTQSFYEFSQFNYGRFESFAGWQEWYQSWKGLVDPTQFDDARKLMAYVNPCVTARNHQVEAAIEQAYQGDFSLALELVRVWKEPFNPQHYNGPWYQAPDEDSRVKRTFCGT
jgi:uncharacterized protein YdiU (UPF0061 family)